MTPSAGTAPGRLQGPRPGEAGHDQGNTAMGIALDILKTAALVGANLLQGQAQGAPPVPQVPQGPSMLDMLKKNASKVYGLLFLRDVIRSLLVTMFLGVAAIVATWSIDNGSLLRAASFFTLAVFLLVAILAGIALATVKSLGFHREGDTPRALTREEARKRELHLEHAYAQGYAHGRMQSQGHAAVAAQEPARHPMTPSRAQAQARVQSTPGQRIVPSHPPAQAHPQAAIAPLPGTGAARH